MAKSKLNFRDSQLQARLGMIFSIASTVLMLILAFVVLENFNPMEKTIGFNQQSMRWPAIMGLVGGAVLLGAIGLGLGFSSLGHKRNMRQRESWLGLVVGGISVCLAIVLLVFFRLFALPIVT